MVSRTPTRVLATPSAGRAAAALAHGDIGIALYNMGRPELPGLGADLVNVAETLPRPPSVKAWDFLSVALAVYAADRFVVRQDAPDAWTRMIALEIEVAEPAVWAEQADDIAATLRFLSGDIWYVRFREGGISPPVFTGNMYDDRDCASLFSGGLDSLIGAIDLLAQGRRPFLVSQASPKEKSVQTYLTDQIGLELYRFSGRATERWRQPYEPSSRARSILFLGYGVMVASTLLSEGSDVDLIIPENGLISINPPLTSRRLGSLSTRTTHPHFIASLQKILTNVGLHVTLTNPYAFKTKGEMLRECRHPKLGQWAAASYSCGKGKRLNQHCGRCVPCLIRRASFHAAGMVDQTPYWAADLLLQAQNEDVVAARFAASTLALRDISRWVGAAGPLPLDGETRAAYNEVVKRGIGELRDFFSTIHWP